MTCFWKYLNFFVLLIVCESGLISCEDEKTSNSDFNPCCSFPCENGGICITKGFDDYHCDCTSLDFYGRNCENPKFFRKVVDWIRPSRENLQYIATHYSWLWWILNRIKPMHSFVMKYIYLSRANMIDSPARYISSHEYITLDSHFNTSYYARSLPPVPKNCPTPMGVTGKKELPDIDFLIKKFFNRKKFIRDPFGTNLLFAYYAQHFTHQFFRTNWQKGPGITDGSEGVDMSHVYGSDLKTRRLLRSFNDGKLKSQILNGEEYPPYLKDAPVPMIYPAETVENQKFALGHPFYGLLPGLFLYATIWLREHNRVCDVLRAEHPEWDDEQLFQTARLILLGETLKITIEDYVQHLSQYKLKLTFEPEILSNQKFQFSNRIRVEFNHLYHWHPLFPDNLQVAKENFTLMSMLYRVDPVLNVGTTEFVKSLLDQQAGALTRNNHGLLLQPILKSVLQHGRDLRLQSFNQYRKRFGLEPKKSFFDLTNDQQMARELEDVYGSVDAVELYVGLVLEAPGYSVTPPTMVEIGGPYSVKGLMSNPLCSPLYWKDSTFGGEVGFEIVKTASLKKLFCQNLNGQCPDVSFKIPDYIINERELEKDEL